MTAVPLTGVADASSRGHIGVWVARGAVAACAALFLVGLGLWARDTHLAAVLWLFPDTWTEADLRRVTSSLGIPLGAVATYFMLLEVLAATAGITAALLVLRGATGWFRSYVAVAIALWVTMGGSMPVVYQEAIDGSVGQIPGVLQGLGWVAVFPLAYLFPDGRFVPRWSRWASTVASDIGRATYGSEKVPRSEAPGRCQTNEGRCWKAGRSFGLNFIPAPRPAQRRTAPAPAHRRPRA